MRRVWVGALALAVMGTLMLPTHAGHAQQDFVEADPLVVRARAQLAAAQLAAHQAAAELEATVQESEAIRASVDEHVAKLEELAWQRAALDAQKAALEAVMRDRAVALYQNGGDGTGIVAIDGARSALNAVRRQTLGEAAATSNRRVARALDEAREALAKVEVTLRDEEQRLRGEQARLDALAAQQEQRRAVVAQRVAAANAALAHARVIGALHAAGEPVIGPATLTAEQMAAWVRSQGFQPRVETDLLTLARLFLEEGGDEGVRGDVAFAQSVIETGGFESAPANNFSGIGWCDTCSVGHRFPDPRQGVRAQMQLLRNYADSGSTSAELAYPVSPYLYGADPVAAARKFDTFYAKGWAPTWSDMGNGNWATDPKYSGKVIGVYRAMVTFAQGG